MRRSLTAALALLAAGAAHAQQPAIWVTGTGSPRLSHDGNSVVGHCFNFPLATYGTYRVTRGQNSVFLFNSDYPSGSPQASGDLSILASE
ncbi:MAG: hypothetical protein K2Q20_10870, partial [Phycisphaerales bacterium]|nr:hypothetical protein [Phycisphaerales bacterium]